MAERFVRFDDLDGTVIEDGKGGTVTVGFADEQYDLDLTEDHINTLKKALDPYLEAGRKNEQSQEATATVPTPRGTKTESVPSQPSRSAVDRQAMGDIRKWAKKNGFKISDRGRIPHAVMAGYMRDNMAGSKR